MSRKILICLCLTAVTIGTYWSVHDHAFIRYDDPEYVFENKNVCKGVTFDNVKWAFRSTHCSNWHPLTWLSHMLDCQLFGPDQPGRHHMTNLLLHVINAMLMFIVLQRMTGAMWRAAFVAMLFALHPLHVESVAWISERKDVLSMIFWLMCILSYVQYTKYGGRYWYAIAVLLLALGLTAKPMLVSTPFLLLLLDYWPLKRFGMDQFDSLETPVDSPRSKNAPDALRPIQRSSTFTRLVMEKIPMLAIVLASSVITYFVQKETGAVDVQEPLMHRLSTTLTAYARYIGKTFWPTNLSPLYPSYSGMYKSWQVIGAAAVLVGITSLVIIQRRKRYLTVGWLWFLGTLVPVIGIVKIGQHSMADRYMYMPMTGLLIMIAWGVADWCRRWSSGKVMAGIGTAVAIGACIVLTHAQVGKWKDSYTLFNHAVHVTKGNYVMHSHLATILNEKGRTNSAIMHYREALRINPDHFYSHNNLGIVLVSTGRASEAIIHFRHALRIKQNSPEVHNNLGNALISLNRSDEAIKHYRLALQIQPDYAEAHNNLGSALAKQNRLQEAIEHFQKAVELNPDIETARRNLERAKAMLNDAQKP